MEKEQTTLIDFLIIPIISFLAVCVVLYKSCYEYAVVDLDSPNLLLAIFSCFPYLLLFAFSFFAKNRAHRLSFYAVLGLLAFMTGFEWLGPKTVEMKNIYSVVWFFQSVFIIPFLLYAIKDQPKIPSAETKK
ncbi:MAG: hypothetical protein R3A80_00180 [Bdellovibrionota bacterium]